MLKPFDPFRELTTLQEKLNQVFDDFLPNLRSGKDSGEWIPAVDIYETPDSVELEFEIPGITEKDIKIRVEDNTLTVSGERMFEKKDEKHNYYRVERSYGSFARSFLLPNNVDPDKIKATYKDGVLKISIPKKPESKPKEIAISKD